MRRSICGLALAAAVTFSTAAYAQNQTLGQPEQRVPGFGGTYSGAAANPPGALGANVGSNVGAGTTSSPVNDDMLPSDSAEPQRPIRGIFGLSRELPLR